MREIVMSARAEKERNRNKKHGSAKAARYDMRLFVAGDEPNSALARTSLERICADHLAGDCHVEIIDVLKDFQPALKENILVTPALIIRQGPARTVIFGNLTNVDRVLAVLNVGSEPS
jgi:circadian clock protein KaiB